LEHLLFPACIASGENEVVNSFRSRMLPQSSPLTMTTPKPPRNHHRIIIHFVSCHSPTTDDAKI
jgi:hypothetical protein